MENNEKQGVQTPMEEKAQPTVEQLNAQIVNLTRQCSSLYEQLQQSNMFNTFKRLDYCFKVIENDGAFDEDFVKYCTNDIVAIMTVANNQEKEA